MVVLYVNVQVWSAVETVTVPDSPTPTARGGGVRVRGREGVHVIVCVCVLENEATGESPPGDTMSGASSPSDGVRGSVSAMAQARRRRMCMVHVGSTWLCRCCCASD